MRDALTGRGALGVRGHSLAWGARTYLMGIVNVTPDSFSGDGLVDAPAATDYALHQLALGADIVDIGAESTRPGNSPIDEATERERLIPVVRAVRERAADAIISIDTFKPKILRAAIEAGGDMLNSVWGLNEALVETAAERAVPVVIMHNRRVAIYEGDVVAEVLAYLAEQASRAVRAGIKPEHVILDPGIGFGKTPEHNIAILASLDKFVALGYPTLLGTSRKSTIGKLTNRPVTERTYGTAATVALAVAAGIDIVRVHDVAEMKDVTVVADAIVRGRRPAGWSDVLP